MMVNHRPPDRRDWKRQYRLSKLLWHYQMVRLDHDDAQALRTLAKRKGVPVAGPMRTSAGSDRVQDQPLRRGQLGAVVGGWK
jgi:hypothetical protein